MYNNRPYVSEPLIAKIGQRVSLLLTYLALLGVGFVAVTAVTVAYLVPFGWALMAFAVLAILGVITGYYRFEWISLPFMITICAIKAVTLWPATTGFAVWLLIAAISQMIYRLIYLTFIAKALRKLSDRVNDD